VAIAGSALSTPFLQLGRGVIGNCDQLEFRVRGTRIKTALSQSNPWSNVPAAGSAESEVVKDDEKRQHLVSWVTSNDEVTEFFAQDGETLRTAALRRGLVSPHNGNARLINCRGLGTCGTCAVEISDCTNIEPPTRNTREKLRLAFPPHGSPDQSPNLRLACQVQIRGDILVTKRAGFWGQDSQEMANLSDAKTYFGDLEFILDNKSPSPLPKDQPTPSDK
jgi:ferredoxin